MYGHADGFIAPCLYGFKEKEPAFVLFNEGSEDVIINSRFVTSEMIKRGGKMRIFGTITISNGVKQISVERFIDLK